MEQKKILLVDDEEEVLEYLGNILRRNNYDVLTAAEGKEAIRLAQTQRPALILLDVLLPDMDGAQVAFTLEQSDATKAIPIIFLTGILTKEEQAPDKKTGTHYTIAKPAEAEEVLSKISEILG
ncbi:two-component system response regulator [Candidatus Omnitrophota bacterium]